jgi:biotin operon repressor
MTADDEYLTLAETAGILRVSASRVSALIRAGELDARRIGARRIVVPARSFRAYIGIEPGSAIPAAAPRDPRKWVTVANAILADIADGKYAPGDRLPGRAELAAAYGVCESTIWAACRHLREQGTLRGVRGHGFYVAQPPG